MLYFLEQHFISSDDKVYWCGLEKRALHSGIFFSRIFLSCSVPTFRGQKVAKHGGHQGISFLFFLIELGPICKSKAASLWLKSCEDHSLLKSYNGGLWKNNYRSRPTYSARQTRLRIWSVSITVVPSIETLQTTPKTLQTPPNHYRTYNARKKCGPLCGGGGHMHFRIRTYDERRRYV